MFHLAKIISILGILATLLAFLPELNLPENVVNALARVFSFAYQWNHIVDIESLIWVFFLTLFAEGVILGWKGVKFVLFLIKN